MENSRLGILVSAGGCNTGGSSGNTLSSQGLLSGARGLGAVIISRVEKPAWGVAGR
jgi:hypothetical protein